MGFLLLILLGAGLYFLLKDNTRPGVRIPGLRSAEETLKQRYVNGEIDDDTYLKMKETLKD